MKCGWPRVRPYSAPPPHVKGRKVGLRTDIEDCSTFELWTCVSQGLQQVLGDGAVDWADWDGRLHCIGVPFVSSATNVQLELYVHRDDQPPTLGCVQGLLLESALTPRGGKR